MPGKTRSVSLSPASRAKAALLRLWHDEDGSILHFVLIVFLLMLAVAGMGVDVMRHEENRALLQATLDRSVLASASLDQQTDEKGAKDIVEDYFRKSGLQAQLRNVDADIELNSRRVSAEADGQLDTIFMRWLGVPRLPVMAASVANETVEDIEIAMVLDVSGSMVQNGSTRLSNLKTAANDFVDIVLGADPPNSPRISIGMVPFNGQVNLGHALRQEYLVTHQDAVPGHAPHSRCVDLPSQAYEALSLRQNLPMPATTWADSFSLANGLSDGNGDRRPDSVPNSYTAPRNSAPADTNRWCPSEPGNAVLLPTRNENTLRNRINGLVGVGATSINAGMRWGMMLLDPASQGIFRRGSGTMQGRPFAFDRPDTDKYMILMTDGAHFPEERINDPYRSGPSPIYRANDGNYSIRHGEGSFAFDYAVDPPDEDYPFWVPHLGEWHWRAWNGSNPPRIPKECEEEDEDDEEDCDRVPANAFAQSWTEVWGGNGTTNWAGVRVSWAAWQLYARPACRNATNPENCRRFVYKILMGTPSEPGMIRTLTSADEMDDQLWDMCAIAHQQGVEIWGIAFQAPPEGEEAIRGCVTNRGSATQGGRYYAPKTGGELQTAFREIASQINALKLLQ